MKALQCRLQSKIRVVFCLYPFHMTLYDPLPKKGILTINWDMKALQRRFQRLKTMREMYYYICYR